jgi:hypothetical protein
VLKLLRGQYEFITWIYVSLVINGSWRKLISQQEKERESYWTNGRQKYKDGKTLL